MHARLAWIGGLGRAQDDIAAQIALFRQGAHLGLWDISPSLSTFARADPGAEQVERLAHTIKHHLKALGDPSVPSFVSFLALFNLLSQLTHLPLKRDLARLRGGTGKKRLILIELLKIVSFLPACLLLASIPLAPAPSLDSIVLIIYSVIALVPSFLLGSLALVGFFDHAFARECRSSSYAGALKLSLPRSRRARDAGRAHGGRAARALRALPPRRLGGAAAAA